LPATPDKVSKGINTSATIIVAYTTELRTSIEALNTTANHQLLNAIANKTGAKMVYPNQIEILEKLLSNKEDIVAVSYSEEKLQDLVNLKWVFYLLMAFLTVEWFLRKRFGGY
jgi:hypothetical protein